MTATQFNRAVCAAIRKTGTFTGEVEGRKYHIERERKGVYAAWYADDAGMICEDSTPTKAVWGIL